MRDFDDFDDRYRAARLLLMDYWCDQIVDIADDGELDPRDRQIRTGVRQWIMSKFVRAVTARDCCMPEILIIPSVWCTGRC